VYLIIHGDDKMEQKLTIIEDQGKYVMCKCECGTIKKFFKSNVKSGHTKSCGCYNSQCSSERAKNSSMILYHKRIDTGSKLIINDFWAPFLKRSKERGLEVSITPMDLEQLFLKQQGKCAFTGIPIKLPLNSIERRKSIQTASLDRIDNNKPYTKDNIQWVHKVTNIMRRSLSIAEFKHWCKLVAEYEPKVNHDQ
jgi:hypothetical protein